MFQILLTRYSNDNAAPKIYIDDILDLCDNCKSDMFDAKGKTFCCRECGYIKVFRK